MCQNLIFAISCAALLLSAASGVQAAVVTITPTAPQLGPADIANFVGSNNDADNVGTGVNPPYTNDATTYVAFDCGGQGQTFLTGNNPAGYRMTGIWLRHVLYTKSGDRTSYLMQAGSKLQVRVTNPAASGTDVFVLASESYTVTGTEKNALPRTIANSQTGTGLWFHVTLDEPVFLAARTLYGFDLTSLSDWPGVTIFETMGIRDGAVAGNPYADGAAYVTGSAGKPNNVLTPAPGDRVFVVELAQPVVVWVSDNKGYNTEPNLAADHGFVDLLRSKGYDVVYKNEHEFIDGTQYWRTLDANKIAELEAADLVIMSRNGDSGSYSTAVDNEPNRWNAVDTPLLSLSADMSRVGRWGWLNGPATFPARESMMRVLDPNHPVFAGVAIGRNGLVEATSAQYTMDWVTGVMDPGNGKILAARPSDGLLSIVTWEAGEKFFDAGAAVAGGPRMLFIGGTGSGNNPPDYSPDGAYNLMPEGQKMFLNAVAYLVGKGK